MVSSFLPLSLVRRPVFVHSPAISRSSFLIPSPLLQHRRPLFRLFTPLPIKRAPCIIACASSTHPPHPPPPSRSVSSRSVQLLNTATNLFPLWVLTAAIIALTHPPAFFWFKSSYIVPTLAFIMLGMGLTISPSSFIAISRTPRLVLLGVAAQYTLMPLLATIVSRLLSLPPPLAAGVILVGVSPGGTASNVVCLLAGANVPLSVVLTLISTLLSVLFIPLLMNLFASTLVPVNPLGLFLSTTQVVLIPLFLGIFLNRVSPRTVKAVSHILPFFSVIAVTLICAAVVAANASAFASVGPRLVLAIGAMHAFGGLIAYILARLSRAPLDTARTISIEVMMQNSTLAVSLANAHFANPLTAVPGAISATMHSILGSVIAGLWRLSDTRTKPTPPK